MLSGRASRGAVTESLTPAPGAVPHIGRSVLLFLLAGVCEIGGGYLVWLWLRASR
jgi:hypothetical protein